MLITSRFQRFSCSSLSKKLQRSGVRGRWTVNLLSLFCFMFNHQHPKKLFLVACLWARGFQKPPGEYWYYTCQLHLTALSEHQKGATELYLPHHHYKEKPNSNLQNTTSLWLTQVLGKVLPKKQQKHAEQIQIFLLKVVENPIKFLLQKGLSMQLAARAPCLPGRFQVCCCFDLAGPSMRKGRLGGWGPQMHPYVGFCHVRPSFISDLTYIYFIHVLLPTSFYCIPSVFLVCFLLFVKQQCWQLSKHPSKRRAPVCPACPTRGFETLRARTSRDSKVKQIQCGPVLAGHVRVVWSFNMVLHAPT